MDFPSSASMKKLEGYVEMCKKIVEHDIAIVNIGFASSYYTESKFEAKTTFVERLSMFGKVPIQLRKSKL